MVDQAVVDGYWRHYQMRRTRQPDADEFDWAWEAVDDAARRGVPGVVDLVVALAVTAPTDDALAYLGAGPMEDLLNQHGPRLVEEVKAAALQNPAVARALRSVVFDDDDEHRRVAERLIPRGNEG